MATFNLPRHSIGGCQVRLSAWESFLFNRGVAESNCASLVAASTRTGNMIRSWVLANYGKRYVPEHILDVLGLRRQLLLRWQREEREGALSIATCNGRH